MGLMLMLIQMLTEVLSHILARSLLGPLQHTIDQVAHESPWGTGCWCRLEGGQPSCLQPFLMHRGAKSVGAKACTLFPLLRHEFSSSSVPAEHRFCKACPVREVAMV